MSVLLFIFKMNTLYYNFIVKRREPTKHILMGDKRMNLYSVKRTGLETIKEEGGEF